MKTEKVIILCCFIFIGIYIIIVASGYPSIPNTMSSGFFPTVASVFLVCLSLAELLLTLFVYNKNTSAGKNDEGISIHRSGLSKILIVTAMLIAMVLIMRYVLPVLGIFIFLLTYLILISKQTIKLSVPISLVGTMVLYLVIKLLRIPL